MAVVGRVAHVCLNVRVCVRARVRAARAAHTSTANPALTRHARLSHSSLLLSPARDGLVTADDSEDEGTARTSSRSAAGMTSGSVLPSDDGSERSTIQNGLSVRVENLTGALAATVATTTGEPTEQSGSRGAGRDLHVRRRGVHC